MANVPKIVNALIIGAGKVVKFVNYNVIMVVLRLKTAIVVVVPQGLLDQPVIVPQPKVVFFSMLIMMH
jgi:hypothetical protein